MQNEILIASSNQHKIGEIKSMLQNIPKLKIYSLRDFSISIDVIEDGATLEENAFKKAKASFDVLKLPSISDDTGLFVDALRGEPGIFSARYAGENATYEDNCRKLLKNLEDIPAALRNANFESVICLYVSETVQHYFKGICKGRIISHQLGKNGFGYDPIFMPNGHEKTFAEMNDKEKNDISHRGKALKELEKFICDIYR